MPLKNKFLSWHSGLLIWARKQFRGRSAEDIFQDAKNNQEKSTMVSRAKRTFQHRVCEVMQWNFFFQDQLGTYTPVCYQASEFSQTLAALSSCLRGLGDFTLQQPQPTLLSEINLCLQNTEFSPKNNSKQEYYLFKKKHISFVKYGCHDALEKAAWFSVGMPLVNIAANLFWHEWHECCIVILSKPRTNER